MRCRLIIVFILINSVLFSQETTVSPFSAQGLGDVGYYGDAYFSGLGGVTIPVIDSTHVNLFNPSSYAMVSQGLPLFSMGFAHQESFFEENELTARDRYTGITQMALVVPFAKRFGLAFGLKPFSRAGYTVNDFELIQGDTMFKEYAGRGEIQEFNFGFSIKFMDRLSHKMLIGANAKRYFGQIDYNRSAYQKSNFTSSGAMESRQLNVGGFGYDVALTYQFRPNTQNVLTLSGFFRDQQRVDGTLSLTRLYFGNFGDIGTYDTLLPTTRTKDKLTLPQRIGGGFAYEFKAQRDSVARSGRAPSFTLFGEYTLDPWSQFSSPFSDADFSYFDGTNARLGMQFIPHKNTLERTAYLRNFQKWSYRLGAYYSELPYRSLGEQVNDMGVSFGIGIPIVLNQAISNLNFSVNYGERSSGSSVNHLQERYIGFNFGLNIAPSYDRWFRKQQLN